MKNKTIIVNPGEDNCPADALMSDFRKNICSKYSRNITFSQAGIEFFKKMCDQYIVSGNGNIITFYWTAIPEEDLPPLKVKIVRQKGKYKLNYLKEYGETEKTLIKGKQGKGRYKNGSVKIIKLEHREPNKNKNEEKGER